jgi:hypothetical protein
MGGPGLDLYDSGHAQGAESYEDTTMEMTVLQNVINIPTRIRNSATWS